MKKQIIKNIFSSYFTNSLQMVLGILLVPFLIIKLGKESFGLIALAESTIGIFEIIAISVRMALSRHATFSLGQGNMEEFVSYLSSGKFILIGCGLLVLSLGGLVSYFFPDIFHVPPELTLQSKFLFALITIAFFITIPNIVYWSILYAKQRFDLINIASSFGLISRAVGIFVLFSILPFKFVNIVTYGFIYLFMRLAENSLIYFWYKQVMPNVRLSFRYFKIERIKEILVFSGYTTLSSLSSVLYDNTSNILINIFFGPAANAIYAVSLKIPMTIKNIFMRATSALTPTVTDLAAKQDTQRMERLFFPYSKFLAILTIPLALTIILRSNQIITFWVGKGFSLSGRLLAIHMISLMIIVPLSIINTIPNAYAKVKIPSQVTFIGAILNVIIGIILAKVFSLGLFGFAISAAICTFLVSGLYVPIYSCNLAKLSKGKYFLQGFVNPFILAVLVVGSGLFLSRILLPYFQNNVLSVLSESVGVLMVMYFSAYHLLLNHNEKNLMLDLLKLKAFK